MKKIFISAGEPSGDLHAAKLMQALLQLEPDTQFIGIGGSNMHKLGLNSILPIMDMSVVGMWEVAKKLPFFMRALKLCKQVILSEKPDLFLPVDYPGFNIQLASYARRTGLPVIYYIAPQLWAWGKNRVNKIRGNVDLILNVLPFEEEFFVKHGINARFVGHPLLDDEFYLQKFPDFDNRDKSIAIFPGSRKQEIIKHKSLIIKIATEINKRLPDYKPVIAKSGNLEMSYFTDLQNIAEISEDSKSLMKNSKAGIIKTGTTNLEAALSYLPGNMFYQTSFLSYSIGRYLVNLNYLSLPNILLNKPVLKEFIQKDARAELIVDDIIDILNNSERYNSIVSGYQEIRNILGSGGASAKAAGIIMDFING